ncbi:LuxR C-terminal-related transcriptional regulator [Nonomuraea sp. NPDC049649]|uniref:helix-turn-helix transcriptional regulator n=1 Tax=Nonomuraea sp. NPDC049649 TaxID=3155776 RepID=UPI00343F3C3F
MAEVLRRDALAAAVLIILSTARLLFIPDDPRVIALPGGVGQRDGGVRRRRFRGGGTQHPARPRPAAPGQGLMAPGVTRRLIAEFARTSKRPRALKPLPGLTAREHDTLMLIARGLSNLEIAESLTVSVSMVKTHVANLPAKIGCRDRVQAIIYAYEHGA